MTRLDQVEQALAACSVWPRLVVEIELRIADLTNKLIAKDDEQTRGAIKELRTLIDLPETLRYERDHLAAALSEQSDAAQ